ncbi:MAG TPA: hypothetical protein VN682_24200, partial [Terriglobales bacterium]|nr:hypothetical protein [Terriglobales bacterium]
AKHPASFPNFKPHLRLVPEQSKKTCKVYEPCSNRAANRLTFSAAFASAAMTQKGKFATLKCLNSSSFS